jgi:regulator of sirC expression with transglutaminase-like and TPR domain
MAVDALARFAQVVQRADDDIELDVAAALIGAVEGDVDVEVIQLELDRLAAIAAGVRAGSSARSGAGARAVVGALFHGAGLRGNADDYYDPRNSFLQHVLARRLGIPITLSVVFLEVARRIGVPASGVGFPGHFLVRVDEPGTDGPVILDPFHGGAELDDAALASLHRKISGAELAVTPALLEAMPKRKILGRMLHNLAGIYGTRGDWFRSLEVLERLALIEADNPRIARDLSSLRERVAALN